MLKKLICSLCFILVFSTVFAQNLNLPWSEVAPKDSVKSGATKNKPNKRQTKKTSTKSLTDLKYAEENKIKKKEVSENTDINKLEASNIDVKNTRYSSNKMSKHTVDNRNAANTNSQNEEAIITIDSSENNADNKSTNTKKDETPFPEESSENTIDNKNKVNINNESKNNEVNSNNESSETATSTDLQNSEEPSLNQEIPSNELLENSDDYIDNINSGIGLVNTVSFGYTIGKTKAIQEAYIKAMPKMPDVAQSAKVVHKFADGVSEIVNAGSLPIFFIAGNDGFVSRYSYPDFKPDTWQLSFMPIKKIALHPKGRLVAIYESDGFSIHQVALWDWVLKKVIFAKRLSDSVVSLSWSAKGKYLFIGNRSTDGITVLDTKGNVQSIYKQAPGIVFLAATASSEKNIVTYGESGRLIYTEISSRKKIKEFRTENKLQNPNLIKNFNQVIGYKNNSVYVINAVNGKVVEQFNANYAIFAAKLQDSTPIWIERTNRKQEWCIRQGNASSKGFYIPGNSKITAARHIKDKIIIGTEDGSIYILGMNTDLTVGVESPLKYSLAKINNITNIGSTLLFLQNGNLYLQNAPDDEPKLLSSRIKANCLLGYNNGVLLWSNSQRGLPLYFYSFETNKLQIIARPRETIISVSVYKNNILYVESFNGVTVVNFDNGNRIFTYNAPGIQNAVQVDDENILLAKSAVDKSQSPLFIINIVTEETAPIQVQGDLVFALEKNMTSPNVLNCFLVNSKPSNKTELVTIKLNSKSLIDSSFKASLSYKEEDVTAFLKASGNDILTNLGKSSLVYYNTATRQAMRLRRSYSLCKDVSILNDYFVTLNSDGTISWYNRRDRKLLRTLGITQ